jgi:phosphoesterase RecJ-like protein
MAHTYPESEHITALIDKAQRIVILQADNPDADSLGSTLALEQILHELGKEPLLYCGIDIPGYLKYLAGWDRVSSDVPPQFDLSIIVDASTMTLFERLSRSGQQGWVSSKPCIVLDHHTEVSNNIPFATVTINEAGCSSTGELIYSLARQLSWPVSTKAQEFMMTAILGDTQGLTNNLARAETYRVLADMVENGVDRPHLEEIRREYTKMPSIIFKYKAKLIERTELFADERIAVVDIPQVEINGYSPLYNPGPLIQNDMLQITNVAISIVLKHYDDGRITAAIRCNSGFPIAAPLAEHFGGGGHAYAAGFKITDGRQFQEVKLACVAFATQLLDTHKQEAVHETI